jgi:hypothetical protein
MGKKITVYLTDGELKIVEAICERLINDGKETCQNYSRAVKVAVLGSAIDLGLDLAENPKVFDDQTVRKDIVKRLPEEERKSILKKLSEKDRKDLENLGVTE